ncbi:MAG: hypothetical protein WCC04_03140 [Terriglobales bacterium]
MPEQVLKIASHVPHPGAVSIIFLVCAAIAFVLALRAKHPIVGSVMAVAIIALGLVPLAVNHVLQSQGVYHIQVVLVRPDQSPVYYAQLKSSQGGEMKIFEGGWRLDIPPQTRPADRRVAFSAAAKDEFLKGSSTLLLTDDYYPTVTIPLVPDTSAKIRGVVVNGDMVAVTGAAVSIAGYPDVAVTDKMGNFVLPAHAGNGQMVEVQAEKDGVMGRVSAPAGKVVEVILGSE